jgi:Ca2+-binding RTX toxin-like protein
VFSTSKKRSEAAVCVVTAGKRQDPAKYSAANAAQPAGRASIFPIDLAAQVTGGAGVDWISGHNGADTLFGGNGGDAVHATVAISSPAMLSTT